MYDHKHRIIRAKQEGNVENIIEVLLSLRVNALQISPELRSNLVSELIKSDIFMIHASLAKGEDGVKLLTDLL